MNNEKLDHIKTAINNINAIIKNEEFDDDFKFELILLAVKRIEENISF